MILTCPDCTTRFLLPAHILAPEGRRVKCSKCGKVWKQHPDPDEMIENLEQSIEEIPESVRPIPEGSSVPVVQEEETPDTSRATALGFAAASLVFILILGGLIFSKTTMIRSIPSSAAFYQLIGMDAPAPGQGLSFDRIHAEANTTTGQIMIDGHILNLTDQEKFVPVIEITLKNKAHEVIAHWSIQPSESMLAAEESMAFSALSPLKTPSGTETVQLRFTLGAGEKAEEADLESKVPEDQHKKSQEHHEPATHH